MLPLRCHWGHLEVHGCFSQSGLLRAETSPPSRAVKCRCQLAQLSRAVRDGACGHPMPLEIFSVTGVVHCPSLSFTVESQLFAHNFQFSIQSTPKARPTAIDRYIHIVHCLKTTKLSFRNILPAPGLQLPHRSIPKSLCDDSLPPPPNIGP